MPSYIRLFSPTQYIRIFVIVNLTSFLVSRTAFESYYTTQAKKFAIEHPDLVQPKQHKAKLSSAQPIYPPYLQTSTTTTMGPTRTKGENTKKAAGNAKKAEAAAQKAASADAVIERDEQDKWSKGAKGKDKKANAEAQKADKAAAKSERDRLLAEEEANQPSKPKGAGKKTAEKKTRGGTLDLGQLDGDATSNSKEKALNATGIDNALDALSLTNDKNAQAVDRHPERRFKAAYKAFEERRLEEMESDGSGVGLRKNQRIERVRKEFERSEENPFNQAGNVKFDATREELAEEKSRLRKGVEGRLAEK